MSLRDARHDPALREQRRQLYRAMMKGHPVPPELADRAETMARPLRLYSWIGALELLVGLFNTVVAVMGGSGGPEWLRWLIAICFVVTGVLMLYMGYRARRLLRSLGRS